MYLSRFQKFFELGRDVRGSVRNVKVPDAQDQHDDQLLDWN